MARDITKLHPLVRILAEELVEQCKEEGLVIKVTDCVRTKEEQNGIDASRTGVKYPNSYHNWGLAFDICQNIPGNPYPENAKWWQKVGQIGKTLGLEWGGDWKKPVDRPHFQLVSYGSCTELVKRYGTPERFWKHTDFKVSTPKLPITPKSVRKKILWLQVMLNRRGYCLEVDGIYGKATVTAVKAYWRKHSGKDCSGQWVSAGVCRLLAK